MCLMYREKCMLLTDGEAAGLDRETIADHLRQCPECRKQFEEDRRLADTFRQMHLSPPTDDEMESFYGGVCSKLKGSARLRTWALAALVLVVAGNMAVFGLRGSTPAMAAGIAAIFGGIALLWTSFYCNCSRR